ncbi:hypothetical protein OESDEN_22517 [Oesophagostomum dentatum]|uniref:Uncharacterized protein n=1 Tax=Oesophagostomum dentatum TaxID=61180 RepID=A0A0B1RXR7_OESDE|nr:hypothetical protein OESDEN_22517 [Oesophagostomum dentatum]
MAGRSDEPRDALARILSEYVLKLAEHVRLLFPEDQDEHLFELEQRIRRLVTAYA